MPTRNINLTKHFDQFVARQVKRGHFQNASEAVRAGLRLLEQQTREDAEKIAALKRMAQIGIDELDRGRGATLHGEKELADYIAAIGKRAARKQAPRRKA